MTEINSLKEGLAFDATTGLEGHSSTDFAKAVWNYNNILNYARENLDKKNLAYLLKNEEVEKLHELFKKNIFFNTFVL